MTDQEEPHVPEDTRRPRRCVGVDDIGRGRRSSPGGGPARFLVLVLLSAWTVTLGGSPAPAQEPGPVLGEVSHVGRWLTDDAGRVLLPTGVNLVAKTPGQTPADMGFDADDATFLADSGFEVVRLGTTAASLMPSPGVIDEAYLDSFQETVDVLNAAGLSVLVDLHQDGWGPTLGSDGFPGWMTITHGAEDTGTEFPLYYVTNPAIQAAFDSFWANEEGPGGVPLQDRVAAMFTALAERFAGNPGVLGYDLLNEPWPGTVWEPCASAPEGCPAQDQALDAYHARMTAAIRAVDATALVFGEPYVLFNFGGAPTTISSPGGDPSSGLSFHLYATDVANEPAVLGFADDWSERTGGALLMTEFGATDDVPAIRRQLELFDASLTPWMWWAYNENFVRDMTAAPVADNVVGPVVDELVRPHPRAVAGTPTDLSYDAEERVLRFRYATDPVSDVVPGSDDPTEISIAPRSYPAGYRAEVTGGTVTSTGDGPLLAVTADPVASEVFVKVWPADQPEPPDEPGPDDAEVPPDPPTTAPPAVPVPARPTFTG